MGKEFQGKRWEWVERAIAPAHLDLDDEEEIARDPNRANPHSDTKFIGSMSKGAVGSQSQRPIVYDLFLVRAFLAFLPPEWLHQITANQR